jgi:hypothetical protein
MKKRGVVNATISMLLRLEYALRRPQNFAAADKVAPAKFGLNGPEVDIQGLMHANVAI